MTLNLEYCFSVKNFYIAKLFCSCNHVVNDYEVYKIIQEGSAEHNLFSYLQTSSLRSKQVTKGKMCHSIVRTGCFLLLAEFKLITHRANAIHFAIRNHSNKIGYIVRYMLCYETQLTTP